MANREMKYSGVEWIGEIPKRWEVMKFKYVMKKDKKIAKKYNNENVISLTKSGVIIRDLENPFGKMPASFDGYQHVEEGDLLLCLFDIDVTPRCVGIVKNNGVTSPAYSRYKLMDGFDINYYNYLLTYLDDEKILLSYTKSLRNTLTDEYFGAVSTIKPSLLEQKKIAAFLDEKVAHIDNIIEDTKKSIENLKFYKQSLITETVTKGLDPNVEMKDSGIEWIGKIPKRWGIEKLKFHSILDPSHKENDNLPEKAQFVPMDNIKDGYLMLSQVRDTDDLVGKYTYFRDGDIVIAKVRPSFENGNIAIASNLENNIGFGTTEIFTLRVVSNKVITEFLFYYLRNSNFLNVASSTMTGVAGLKRISSSFLMNYKIGIPDIEEQSRIVRYLDEKIDKIDSLLRQKEQIVTELDSYKKSLIYEYVTGKKEVK